MPFQVSNGTTVPHATDYLDLMDKVVAFVTSGALGAQAWTALRNISGEKILQGPGLAGTDQIFVGMKAFSDVPTDYYDWWLSGFTGYTSANSFETQPGAHHTGIGAGQSGPILPLWNGTIPYWLQADGRKIILVAKVSTVYVHMYLGLLEFPYASPGQFPYPLFIGGSLAFNGGINLTSPYLRWSYTGTEIHAWWRGRSATSTARDHAGRLRLPDGSYMGFGEDYGWAATSRGYLHPFSSGFEDMRPNMDGSYPLFPLAFAGIASDGSENAYGEIQQVCAMPGYANASESVVTVGSDSWIAFQNIFRTDKKGYAALHLS